MAINSVNARQNVLTKSVSRGRLIKDGTPIPFNNNGTPLNMIQYDGELWFIAIDVAKSLGYRDTLNMCRILDDDEYKTVKINATASNNTNTVIVSESGLYHAIFLSRKPNAKAFRRWVTETVLPSIRRTGGYLKREISNDLWLERMDIKANLKIHYQGDDLRKAMAVTNVNPMTFDECYSPAASDVRAYRSRQRKLPEEYQRELIKFGYIDEETLEWVLCRNKWIQLPSNFGTLDIVRAMIENGLLSIAREADIERDCPHHFQDTCGEVYSIAAPRPRKRKSK